MSEGPPWQWTVPPHPALRLPALIQPGESWTSGPIEVGAGTHHVIASAMLTGNYGVLSLRQFDCPPTVETESGTLAGDLNSTDKILISGEDRMIELDDATEFTWCALTITAAAAGNPVYDPDADPDAPAVPDPVAAVPSRVGLIVLPT